MECPEQTKPKKSKHKPKTYFLSTRTTEAFESFELSSSSSQILEEITQIPHDLNELSTSTTNTTPAESAKIEIKSAIDVLDPSISEQSSTSKVLTLQLLADKDTTISPELEFPEVIDTSSSSALLPIIPEPDTPEVSDTSSASALLPIIPKPVTSQAIIDSKIQEDQNAVTDFFRTNYRNFEPLPSSYPSEPAVYLIPEDQVDYSKLKYNYKMMKHIIIVETESTETAVVPEPEPEKPASTKFNYTNLRELIDENYAAEAGKRRRDKENEVNSNREFVEDTESCSETIDSKDQLSADSSSRLEIDEALLFKSGLLRDLSDLDLDDDETMLFGSILDVKKLKPKNSLESKPSTTLGNVFAEIKYWATAKFRNAWRVLKSIKTRISTSWKNHKRSRQVGPMASISDKSRLVRTKIGEKRQSPNKAKAQALMRKNEPRNSVKVVSEIDKILKPSHTLVGTPFNPFLIYPDCIGIGSSTYKDRRSVKQKEKDSFAQLARDHKKLREEVAADTLRMAEELFKRAPQTTIPAPASAGFRVPDYNPSTLQRNKDNRYYSDKSKNVQDDKGRKLKVHSKFQ